MSFIVQEKKEEAEDEDFGNKVLFTGLSQSGKTSIIQVVFKGIEPEATKDLPPTVRYTRQKKQLKGFEYYIVDVGGQIPYLEEIFDVLEETIFTNLNYLFYVVDVENIEVFYQAREYFALALKSVEKICMNATITVLAHKMDLIPEEEREEKIKRISEIFFLDSLEHVNIYGTSIYEDSIFDVLRKVLVEKQ
jgi:GTPase SAR1 family protein